jgi:uncharacterized membrane protein
MTTYLIAYAVVAFAILAIDAVWLGLVAKNFYSGQLGNLMADDIKMGIAAAFYATYAIGVVVFAVVPGLNAGSVLPTIGYAALFGFLAYGTYDFTNLATIRDWPVTVTIVDLIWGTSLTTVTAVIGYYATRFFTGG